MSIFTAWWICSLLNIFLLFISAVCYYKYQNPDAESATIPEMVNELDAAPIPHILIILSLIPVINCVILGLLLLSSVVILAAMLLKNVKIKIKF